MLCQVASHAQKYFARLQGTTKRKSRFTSLEEKAHSVSPVAGNPEALQALQALPHTHLPAQPGVPRLKHMHSRSHRGAALLVLCYGLDRSKLSALPCWFLAQQPEPVVRVLTDCIVQGSQQPHTSP